METSDAPVHPINDRGAQLPEPWSGRVEVASVADLQRLCGGRATVSDAATLWRLLRTAGLLDLEEEHAVIEVATREEFTAWVTRATVAARRERNEGARWTLED